MTLTDPLTGIVTRPRKKAESTVPQTVQVRDDQVLNNAGGYVFKVSGDEQLRRFLILGTEGGTFYQGERELTKDNAKLILEYAENAPERLVEIVTEISLAGRAPKQNPTLFALAAATNSSSLKGRQAAFAAIPAVVRTASQLTLFVSYAEQFRGFGTGFKKALQNWYADKNADQLAYQLVKYRSRNGYSQRDLLRLVHPQDHLEIDRRSGINRVIDPAKNALYSWITQGDKKDGLPRLVNGFLLAQEATDAKDWERIVRDYRLSWEMLPDAALGEVAVWNALLDNGIPLNALIRHLPRLTNLGVVGSALKKGSRTADIVAKITDGEYLRKSRIHPFNVLVAQKTYAEGRSFRGSSTWTPVRPVVDALNDAFYLAFGNVEPANKRTLIALDVSTSMGSPILNSPLRSCEVTAAFSLVTTATEPFTETYAFTSGSGGWNRGSTGFSKLNISPKQRLDDVSRTVIKSNWGSTDVSLPFTEALKLGLEVDTFHVLTDNETYGHRHVHQALENYRNKTGIPARLIVSATTPTEYTVGDPADAGTLNTVGIDSALPTLISDFSAGRV